VKGKDNLKKVAAAGSARAQKMTAEERVREIDERCLIHTSPALRQDGFDLFNTLLLFPIAKPRFRAMLQRFSRALDARRKGSGRSREEELLLEAGAAVSKVVGDLSGCAFTFAQWREEMDRRVNREVTESLLGTEWTREKGKDKPNQKPKLHEICFDRISLKDRYRPDPALDLIEMRLELDAYSRFLAPRERQLFSLSRLGFTRREAAARMKISPATVDVMFGNIENKLRAV